MELPSVVVCGVIAKSTIVDREVNPIQSITAVPVLPWCAIFRMRWHCEVPGGTTAALYTRTAVLDVGDEEFATIRIIEVFG